MKTTPCLCETPANLLCPEHEQDTEELRGKAYETLAAMYLDARGTIAALVAASRVGQTEYELLEERVGYLQSRLIEVGLTP